MSMSSLSADEPAFQQGATSTFQDVLCQLAKVHDHELLQAQAEANQHILALKAEVVALHEQLRKAGIDPWTPPEVCTTQPNASSTPMLFRESNQENQALRAKGTGRMAVINEEQEEGLEKDTSLVMVQMENRKGMEEDDIIGGDGRLRMSGESAMVATATKSRREYQIRSSWMRQMDTSTWGISIDVLLAPGRAKTEYKRATSIGEINTTGTGPGCFVIFPNSSWRLYWDLVGLILISYDVFLVPFQFAFKPSDNYFTFTADMIALAFWTGDMLQGFVLGYYKNGHYVTSHWQILKHYFMTWFIIDVIVVVPEWYGQIDNGFRLNSKEGNQISGFMSVFKGARVFRMIRLVRLLKLQRIINMLYDIIESEYTFIFVNLFKLLIFVLVFNHAIACAWYEVGKYPPPGKPSWVQVGLDSQDTIMYNYTTALHWSLTQFTPASMDVSAKNVYERTFSIIVLFFAMVAFSSIVGSITGSMTSLRNMKNDELKQFWLLRRYLNQRSIDPKLAVRIFKFLEHQSRSQSNLVQARNIAVLKMLSEALHNELTHSLHSPHLLGHPFFMYVDQNMKVVMHKLCRFGLTNQSYAEGEIVFGIGDEGKKMYFVKRNKEPTLPNFQYTMIDRSKLDPPPKSLEAIAEAVMWTTWRHQGDLMATNSADLLVMDPGQFVEVMSVHPRPWFFAKKYARHFLGHMNRPGTDPHDFVRDADFLREDASFSELMGVNDGNAEESC